MYAAFLETDAHNGHLGHDNHSGHHPVCIQFLCWAFVLLWLRFPRYVAMRKLAFEVSKHRKFHRMRYLEVAQGTETPWVLRLEQVKGSLKFLGLCLGWKELKFHVCLA